MKEWKKIIFLRYQKVYLDIDLKIIIDNLNNYIRRSNLLECQNFCNIIMFQGALHNLF